MFNTFLPKILSDASLLPKETRFIFLGLMHFLRVEAQMTRDEGIYKKRCVKLSNFVRSLHILKCAYFPPSIESLKFRIKA